MTSYLVYYLTRGARLFGRGENTLGFRLSPYGVLPHEIAALNAHRAAARHAVETRRAAAARAEADPEPVGRQFVPSRA